MQKGRLILALALALPLPLLVARTSAGIPMPAVQFVVPPKAPSSLSVVSMQEIADDGLTVHAATMIADGQSGLLAAWFEGSREGASDVAIHTARFDGVRWDKPRILVDSHSLSKGTGQLVDKLGNPVLYRQKDGTIDLFVVAVPLGGWAVSRIAHLQSRDNGETFVSRGVLPLSPFLNVSHLVRGSVMTLADGGFILPAYFEMGATYPVLVRFDKSGTIIARDGMTDAAKLIQPWPAISSADQATLFLRDMHASNRKVWSMRYNSATRDWDEARALATPNPNASVAAIASEDGGYWVALNPDDDSRSSLVLQKFDARGGMLDRINIADSTDGLENSYPAILATPDGRTHLMFTRRRQAIAHVILERAAP